MKWLSNPDEKEVSTIAEPQQQQQDALYALGVAGLASEKLLSKHKLCHSESGDIVDVNSGGGRKNSPSLRQKLIRSILRAPPKAAKSLWRLGGGRHNMKRATAFSAAVACVLAGPATRTAVVGAVSGAVNITCGV